VQLRGHKLTDWRAVAQAVRAPGVEFDTGRAQVPELREVEALRIVMAEQTGSRGEYRFGRISGRATMRGRAVRVWRSGGTTAPALGVHRDRDTDHLASRMDSRGGTGHERTQSSC